MSANGNKAAVSRDLTDTSSNTIDLRSDTVTLPTPEMWRAMATAELGDDVYGEDPTINDLQAFAAKLLGKERALFFPSATMANQVAVLSHTDRGDELFCDRDAHIYFYEAGSPAMLAGDALQTRAFEVLAEPDTHSDPQVRCELLQALGGAVGQHPLAVDRRPAVHHPGQQVGVAGHVGVGDVHAGEPRARGVLRRPRRAHRHPQPRAPPPNRRAARRRRRGQLRRRGGVSRRRPGPPPPPVGWTGTAGPGRRHPGRAASRCARPRSGGSGRCRSAAAPDPGSTPPSRCGRHPPFETAPEDRRWFA